MTSLSFPLKRSREPSSLLRLGNIHRLGNIQLFSHLARESCLCRALLLSPSWLVVSSFCFSSMMLLDMHAIWRKSSSNFFHMSLDSWNMVSLTRSKSSQEDLKKGSSKKKSRMVIGTLLSAILLMLLLLLFVGFARIA